MSAACSGRWTTGIDGGNGGKSAVLLMSSTQQLIGQPFQGASLHVALNVSTLVKRIGPLNGVGNGQGWGSGTVFLPNDPLFLGQPIYAQWLVIDPQGAGIRLCSTDAVAMTFQ